MCLCSENEPETKIEPLPSDQYALAAKADLDESTLTQDDRGRLSVARRAYLEINDGDSVFLDRKSTRLNSSH